MTTRIYAVQDTRVSEKPAPVRLVRAASQSQALRHVASDSFKVAVASQDVLVQGMTNGQKVEDASEPAAE